MNYFFKKRRYRLINNLVNPNDEQFNLASNNINESNNFFNDINNNLNSNKNIFSKEITKNSNINEILNNYKNLYEYNEKLYNYNHKLSNDINNLKERITMLITDKQKLINENNILINKLNITSRDNKNMVSDIIDENNRLNENIKKFIKISNLNDIYLCILCYTNIRDIIFNPCRHSVVCNNCNNKLANCPVCRKKINSVTKYYF